MMCNNKLAPIHHVIDNVQANNVFLIEIMFISNAIKSCFEELYEKQNLTLVDISYEMTTRVQVVCEKVEGKKSI